MLKKGRVVVMSGRNVVVVMSCNDAQSRQAIEVASNNVFGILPQYKIDKQRCASVLRDPVHHSLLTMATVASCQTP